MTKVRAPLTVDAALSRIAGQLEGGWEEMGRAVDKSASYLRACGDPERREKLSIDDAIVLDLAYEASGGEGYPLYMTYEAKLELAQAERFACRFALLRRTAALIKEGGEAHSALARACLPDATEADFRAAQRELAEAWEEIRLVMPLLAPETRQEPRPASDMATHLRAPP